jgi:phosphohistidine phosphatase
MRRRLHLLRHAKSSWDDPALRDRDRPLAPRGQKAVARIERWVREHDVRPQLVLCSDARRARETLEGVLSGLDAPDVRIEEGLYAASAQTIVERLRSLPHQVDEVMLVGHNPGLADVLLLLAEPGELRERAQAKVPTGALATVEGELAGWSELEPGCARLVSFVVPRDIR